MTHTNSTPTITVNLIQGQRGSACNNDAYSVVQDDRHLLAVIPTVPNLNPKNIADAFTVSAALHKNIKASTARDQAISQFAGRLLKLRLCAEA